MKANSSLHPARFWFSVLLRGLVIFIIFNLAFPAIQPSRFARLSAYNALFPGRVRLPFGEDSARSYNLSLYDLDAMFASHEAAADFKVDELRVFVFGDSSVWGTLLGPQETLSGQLNARHPQVCGQPAHFFNLGYPTISLAKDLLLMNRALVYEPDIIIWLTTLEAFPVGKQAGSPLAVNNRPELSGLLNSLGLERYAPDAEDGTWWQGTLISQRRALKDLARLQLYGVMWAATGIDQDLTQGYQPAELNYEADLSFHGLEPGADLSLELAWDLLAGGQRLAGSIPVLLVNEPILISQGQNSHLRYNLFYPRWAYDEYRLLLADQAKSLGFAYLDTWDLAGPTEFTNSAIHLNPQAEARLADKVANAISDELCH